VGFFVVQRLVEKGIPLETENKEKETACDCAEKNGHSDIALFLESKMVFSSVNSSSHFNNGRVCLSWDDQSLGHNKLRPSLGPLLKLSVTVEVKSHFYS